MSSRRQLSTQLHDTFSSRQAHWDRRRQLRLPNGRSSSECIRRHSSNTNEPSTSSLNRSLHLPSVPFSLAWIVLTLVPLAEARPLRHLKLTEPKKPMVRLAKSETLEQRPARSLHNFSQAQPLRTRLRSALALNTAQLAPRLPA